MKILIDVKKGLILTDEGKIELMKFLENLDIRVKDITTLEEVKI